MNSIKKVENFLIGIVLALLAALTLSVIFKWQYAPQVAYTFFIAWAVLFVYYMVVLRNYYSLLLLGLAAGATGLYLLLLNPGSEAAAAALLLGKITLSLFTAFFAYRLYTIKNDIEQNSIIYLVLVGTLVLQIATQNNKEIDALSLAGILNYITVGVIINVLLNGQLSKYLKKGELAVLINIALLSLYNIAILLIANFG